MRLLSTPHCLLLAPQENAAVHGSKADKEEAAREKKDRCAWLDSTKSAGFRPEDFQASWDQRWVRSEVI